jgi:hypothetical protein
VWFATAYTFVALLHNHESVIILASSEHNLGLIGIQPNCRREAIGWNTGIEPLFENTVENREGVMGRGILLWLLGVPIPIIILLALIWH